MGKLSISRLKIGKKQDNRTKNSHQRKRGKNIIWSVRIGGEKRWTLYDFGAVALPEKYSSYISLDLPVIEEYQQKKFEKNAKNGK